MGLVFLVGFITLGLVMSLRGLKRINYHQLA